MESVRLFFFKSLKLIFFEAVVVSEAIGFAKPSPEIFHHALSRFNVTSAEVLYVGDSLKHDYAGATQVKMYFCYTTEKTKIYHKKQNQSL